MDDPLAAETLALSIARITQERHLVVVCVGTDRSTGDSLGPLIGTGLLKHLPPNITVYGCLDEPVHALNLENFVTKIKSKHQDSLVLAIDACRQIGKCRLYLFKTGPLKPGTGVNKALPEIGDFHIIGVVNVGGMMEYFVLQNTRLSLVIRMSEIIIKGLLMSVRDVSVHRA